MPIQQYQEENFTDLCNVLAKKDAHLRAIIRQHGYPPLWTRPASFQTLVLIILEQQVSLSAAYAAYKKLREKIGLITPQKIKQLSDEDLRACYFTRQKTGYTQLLADAILNKELNLKKLSLLPDEEVRTVLKKYKGIGDWSVDIYLMQALQRTDVFPLGDLALVNSIKEVKALPKETGKEALLEIGEAYRPYRTIAAKIYWHAYIKKRNIRVGD